MARADDVTPGDPQLVDTISSDDFGLSETGWVVEVWTDCTCWRRIDDGRRSVSEFPDYPGEFYVALFGFGKWAEDLIGPFPNLATAVAFFELTKT